jgi:hypothetical protein
VIEGGTYPKVIEMVGAVINDGWTAMEASAKYKPKKEIKLLLNIGDAYDSLIGFRWKDAEEYRFAKYGRYYDTLPEILTKLDTDGKLAAAGFQAQMTAPMPDDLRRPPQKPPNSDKDAQAAWQKAIAQYNADLKQYNAEGFEGGKTFWGEDQGKKETLVAFDPVATVAKYVKAVPDIAARLETANKQYLTQLTRPKKAGDPPGSAVGQEQLRVIRAAEAGRDNACCTNRLGKFERK